MNEAVALSKHINSHEYGVDKMINRAKIQVDSVTVKAIESV